MSVRFSNGALGIVDAFFSIPDDSSKNRLEIYGSGEAYWQRELSGSFPPVRRWPI